MTQLLRTVREGRAERDVEHDELLLAHQEAEGLTPMRDADAQGISRRLLRLKRSLRRLSLTWMS